LNSSTGGYDDTAGTQYYIERGFFRQCEFLFNSAPSTKILLQFNKAFNCGVYESFFNAGFVQLNVRGSDVFACRDTRFDSASGGCVLDESFGTFGTHSVYEHNDMNQPNDYFIRWNSRKITIRDNHIELDSARSSTGTGGNMEAAFDCIAGGGGAFHTVIQDNLIALGTFADKWLRYRAGTPFSLVVTDNGNSAFLQNADIGNQPYFNNSGTRFICIHRGNMGSDHNFPMNYEGFDEANGSSWVYLSANRPGINSTVGLGPIVNGVVCNSGYILISANADTSKYVEWSDWIGLQANQLIGTCSVDVVSYGGVNGQVLSYSVLDNGAVKSTGTIAHAFANQLFKNNLATTVGITAKLQIRLWNADTGHGANVGIRNVEVRFG
jgi:hypothetical protein